MFSHLLLTLGSVFGAASVEPNLQSAHGGHHAPFPQCLCVGSQVRFAIVPGTCGFDHRQILLFYHCVLLKSEEPRVNPSYVDPHSGGEDGAYKRARTGLCFASLLHSDSGLCLSSLESPAQVSTPSATTLVLAMWYLARHISVTRSALLATNLSAHRSRKIILQTGLLFELSFLDSYTGCFPTVFRFGPDFLPCCFCSLCVKMTLGGGGLPP